MKKIISYIALTLFIGCSQVGQDNNTNIEGENANKEVDNANILCSSFVPYSGIQICMPEIDGMKECYSNEKVKQFADRTAGPGVSFLAYYLNNAINQNIEILDTVSVLNDIFQVSVVDAMHDEKFGIDMLDEIQSLLVHGLSGELWENVKVKLKNSNFIGTVEKPINIENYSPKENVRTIITLDKSQLGSDVFICVKILNLVLIKEKIISIAYCNQYNSDESIKNAKIKNELFVNNFVISNR